MFRKSKVTNYYIEDSCDIKRIFLLVNRSVFILIALNTLKFEEIGVQ